MISRHASISERGGFQSLSLAVPVRDSLTDNLEAAKCAFDGVGPLSLCGRALPPQPLGQFTSCLFGVLELFRVELFAQPTRDESENHDRYNNSQPDEWLNHDSSPWKGRMMSQLEPADNGDGQCAKRRLGETPRIPLPIGHALDS